MNKAGCGVIAFICYVLVPAITSEYVDIADKDSYMTNVFLVNEFLNHMNKDFNEVVDSYIDPVDVKPSRLELMSRASKDPDGEQLDYEPLLNGDPNPSLRDHEYLQHSSLWGHQYVNGGTGELEGYHMKSHVKTDASLPAYCNPPNPCPVGVHEDQGCQLSFENTAAFSREYQSEQECMCDGEHMFDCKGGKEEGKARQRNTKMETYFNNRFQMPEHKKMDPIKSHGWVDNPYLKGKKLRIAAKKGYNAHYA